MLIEYKFPVDKDIKLTYSKVKSSDSKSGEFQKTEQIQQKLLICKETRKVQLTSHEGSSLGHFFIWSYALLLSSNKPEKHLAKVKSRRLFFCLFFRFLFRRCPSKVWRCRNRNAGNANRSISKFERIKTRGTNINRYSLERLIEEMVNRENYLR